MQHQSDTFSLASLLNLLISTTYKQLHSLANNLQEKNDLERKLVLRDFLQNTRNQLIKLLVVVKWSKNSESVKRSWEIVNLLERQDNLFKEAADSLYYAQSRLQGAKAPVYDVFTAVDVLSTGGYKRLPSIIEKPIPAQPLNEEQIEETLSRLTEIIRLRLFAYAVPPQFSVKIGNGRAYCTVDKEFEVCVTVDGEGPKDLWRVVSVDVFLANKHESVRVTPMQLFGLKELLQRRVVQAEEPFVEMYNILHTFCLSLQLYALYSQAMALSKTSTSLGAMRVEYENESRLTVHYWVTSAESPRVSVSMDASSASLSIHHVPQLVNPLTGKPPVLQGGVQLNLEELLLRLVRLHMFCKLHRLHRCFLQSNLDCKQEVELFAPDGDFARNFLRAPLLDNVAMFVSVSLSSGEFQLRLEPAATGDRDIIKRAEEELNRRPDGILEVFGRLRERKLVEHYSLFGYWLGLEPFKEVAALKYGPKVTPTFGAGAMFLRFPEPVSGFLLATEFVNFRPKFFLLQIKRGDGLVVEKIHPVLEMESRSGPAGSAKEHKSTLESVVALCRKKMGRIIFTEQLVAKGIEHRFVGDGVITFCVPCRPLQVESLEVSFADTAWEVSVREQHGANSSLAKFKSMQRRAQARGSHIAMGANGWHLTYKGTPTEHGYETLMGDLQGIATVLKLLQQFHKLTKFHESFSLESFSPTHITLLYRHPSGFSSRLSLNWRPEAGFALSFSHPLARYFEMLVNREQDMRSLLQQLACSLVPVHMISNYASEASRTDFALIPRSTSQLRLVFRNQFGVDFRFLTEESVTVDDAGASLFGEGGLEPSQKKIFLQRIPSWGALLNYIQKRAASDFSTGDSFPGLVPHSALESVLQLLHSYLGASSQLNEAENSLAALEKETTLKRGPRTPDKMSFAVGKLQVMLSIQEFSELQLQISQQELLADAVDTATLCHYFKEKVARAPYSKDLMAHFLAILALPAQVVREFTQVMKLELERVTTGQVELNLAVLSHDKPNSRIHFSVRLRKREEDSWLVVMMLYVYDVKKTSVLQGSPANSALFEEVKGTIELQGNQPLSVTIANLLK